MGKPVTSIRKQKFCLAPSITPSITMWGIFNSSATQEKECYLFLMGTFAYSKHERRRNYLYKAVKMLLSQGEFWPPSSWYPQMWNCICLISKSVKEIIAPDSSAPEETAMKQNLIAAETWNRCLHDNLASKFC